MKKLKNVRVKEAIHTPLGVKTFVTSEEFDLTLRDGIIIDIKSKKDGSCSQTSLFNVSYWTEEPGQEAKGKK